MAGDFCWRLVWSARHRRVIHGASESRSTPRLIVGRAVLTGARVGRHGYVLDHSRSMVDPATAQHWAQTG
jgi:hypothetical protein